MRGAHTVRFSGKPHYIARVRVDVLRHGPRENLFNVKSVAHGRESGPRAAAGRSEATKRTAIAGGCCCRGCSGPMVCEVSRGISFPTTPATDVMCPMWGPIIIALVHSPTVGHLILVLTRNAVTHTMRSAQYASQTSRHSAVLDSICASTSGKTTPLGAAYSPDAIDDLRSEQHRTRAYKLPFPSRR